MNTSSYLFLNSENIKYNEISGHNGVYAGYPQPVSKDWPNLPVEFQRHIDDVINLNGYLYFFKGSQYLKFDIAKARVAEGPKPIVEGWPGLIGTEFENGIDAATEWIDIKTPDITDVVCFFKGSECIDYTVSSHTINQKTISEKLGTTGKYSEFSTNLDAAILWRTRGYHYIFIFKGNSNIRFNLKLNAIDGGPTTPNKINWLGVTFNKIQAAVSVDTDLLGSQNCGGTCGNNDTGNYCFQLPQSTRFRLTAYTNTDVHQQTIKIYIDDILVDTLTGKGVDNLTATKSYSSGTGKICIEITGNGKPCKLRYSDNTLDGKPGSVIIGAESGTEGNYNDSVVVLNWPLT
ncbi:MULTISPECIES: fucose-binding lectin II [Photorhabdus]|uniref:fucose-binding lectin II n=1 Tax=Photorhabdus TaxID=29487 RepID=UPI000DCD9B7A|nr:MULTISPECIES: fucose-binding lectin II [Photorhabdus]MCT8344480.1 hemopexin repeat-containing protein [Photorhabdus kleinii]RAW97807.1 photopexin B [Photorhabdus sp. S10-54]RAW97888.1 photopexin B [Photorhabdus sp. S9-53]RAX02126.1 photopexin B [Photorhabdus sp. S8-52]